MVNNKQVYSIEVLCRGKYESWEFEKEEERDRFYESVKKKFADHAFEQEPTDVEDTEILQLSANSMHIDDEGEVDQKMRYDWFHYDSFGDMLSYINGQYKNK
ncbi:hypothetical protein BBI11_09840 [Planococcus maritimus]|uniref:hypothetical protein n=1 Tax=Planococcus maritimus TaxID=192421 RepID=UPI00080F1846|nr:hypothetical protein [Planococcus maritimus]ANU17303.1 hypothetical protein BBI11_09840 [Planococcus maritimus]